MTEDENITEV